MCGTHLQNIVEQKWVSTYFQFPTHTINFDQWCINITHVFGVIRNFGSDLFTPQTPQTPHTLHTSHTFHKPHTLHTTHTPHTVIKLRNLRSLFDSSGLASNTYVQSYHVQYQTSLAQHSNFSSPGFSWDRLTSSLSIILGPSLYQSSQKCQSYTSSPRITMHKPVYRKPGMDIP